MYYLLLQSTYDLALLEHCSGLLSSLQASSSGSITESDDDWWANDKDKKGFYLFFRRPNKTAGSGSGFGSEGSKDGEDDDEDGSSFSFDEDSF